MALIHEFILVPKSDYTHDYYLKIERNNYGEIDVHKTGILELVIFPDELILYINDSLQWIPTINPATSKKGFGLNYCGVTTIDKDGSSIAESVFLSWANLFSNAPNDLKLTGSWTWSGTNENVGEYEKLVYEKDAIVSCFSKLASYCNMVTTRLYYIVHLGI